MNDDAHHAGAETRPEAGGVGVEDPRAVLRRHGLRPKHAWGQNYLVNLPLVERIADAAAATGAELVIEIGAGAGTLTAALAARVPRVIAIERDPDMVALLEAERPNLGDNVEIVAADAVAFDYAAAAAGRELAIVGNLPYQLTGRLLRRIIEARRSLAGSVVTIQREVADRLVARPNAPGYGILTVMCQAWLTPTVLWKVAPGSFFPRPKVGSAVVRLAPDAAPRAGDVAEPDLATVVHAAFAARRKTLRNTLGARFDKAAVRDALGAAGIDPGLRAEALTVEQFAGLARRLTGATS